MVKIFEISFNYLSVDFGLINTVNGSDGLLILFLKQSKQNVNLLDKYNVQVPS